MDNKELIQKMYKFEEGLLKQRYERVKEEDIDTIFNMMQDPMYVEILKEDMDLLTDLMFSIAFEDADIANFYMFTKTNSEVSNVWVSEARDYVEDLLFYSYIDLHNHVFYFDKKDLIDLAKKMLKNSFKKSKHFNKYITPYISKEKMVSIFLDGESEIKIIEDLIDKVDIEILLNLNPKPAFKTSNGDQVYCSYIEDLTQLRR